MIQEVLSSDGQHVVHVYWMYCMHIIAVAVAVEARMQLQNIPKIILQKLQGHDLLINVLMACFRRVKTEQLIEWHDS